MAKSFERKVYRYLAGKYYSDWKSVDRFDAKLMRAEVEQVVVKYDDLGEIDSVDVIYTEKE